MSPAELMLVSFHDLAKRELNEAAEYDESESAGLGQAFISQVERSADEIVRYPEAGLLSWFNPSPSDTPVSRTRCCIG